MAEGSPVAAAFVKLSADLDGLNSDLQKAKKQVVEHLRTISQDSRKEMSLFGGIADGVSNAAKLLTSGHAGATVGRTLGKAIGGYVAGALGATIGETLGSKLGGTFDAIVGQMKRAVFAAFAPVAAAIGPSLLAFDHWIGRAIAAESAGVR